MEPGRFRTHLLSDTNLHFKQSQISDYEVASATHGSSLHGSDFRQPGDPRKFVQIVIDLVRQEGCSVGKKIPLRLPVGRDAVNEIQGKLDNVVSILQEWDSVITSTDY